MLSLSAISVLPLVITFLSVSCSPSVPVTVNLSEKDFGRTVEMRVGDTLEIILRGNPTTGYIWDIAPADTAILEKVGETEFKADRKVRGSGGVIIMRFKAAMVGKTLLKLIYHRSFEKDKPPVKTFEATVTVR